MPAQLVALSEGPSILLDKPILLIGRHPECDIQIDSRKVSRRHCCIAQVHDYLVVRDLGSTNGIRINGVRVGEGRLKPGDELIIGQSRYRVQWDSMADLPAIPRNGAEPFVPPPAAEPVASAGRRTAMVPDDLLEDCDDPVPLPDGDANRFPPAVPVPGTSAQPPSFRDEPYGPRPPADRPILPEVLELAPGSDVIPRPPFRPPT